jgi:hypothetical protein
MVAKWVPDRGSPQSKLVSESFCQHHHFTVLLL